MTEKKRWRGGGSFGVSSIGSWAGGVAFTFAIAWIGYGLSRLPGPDHIGQLACAILIAVVYRQLFGYPDAIRSGIQFASKKLLRYAIVLYGLKLNMGVVFEQGFDLLLRDAGVIVFSIALTMLLARWLKAEMSVSLLLGIGTGICGAAAIAAVSPILKAKEEDTAIGVGIIALVGTLFAIGYTVLLPLLPMTPAQYGIWSGTSLHEIAHVALAAAPAGEDALAMGLLAKLGRVFLLVPLCFLLMYRMKRKNKTDAAAQVEFPWFLGGFLLTSLLGSYVFGRYIVLPAGMLNHVSDATTFLLTMAMTGLGLNVSLRDVRTRALRPLAAMGITSIALSVITYFMLV
ncbi:YeiH family protein [Paenibacillus solanacearum]|nr:putative sulfate exporter family transporter [Paenibacillus solanacearum]